MEDIKICTKCKTEKELSQFNNIKSICIICEREYNKKYREENKESIKEKAEKNKEEKRKYDKEYYQKNKTKVDNRQKEYQKNNHESYIKYQKEYNSKNKEKSKAYRKKNKEKYLKLKRDWIKKKKETDPIFLLQTRVRKLIPRSIKRNGYSKKSKSMDILGISWAEFKIHIENLFQDGMSWENFGKWHLDHKIPLSWAKNEEETLKLCKYENLQPLWAEDNLFKGNRFKSE